MRLTAPLSWLPDGDAAGSRVRHVLLVEDDRIIPVVILTTSQAPEDILRSFRLHANAYITKPPGFEPFTAAIYQASGFPLALSRQPA